MSKMSQTPTAADCATRIRQAMAAKNVNIPPVLDTPLNLMRWWKGFNGDIAKITQRFTLYLHNRRVCGFDRDDFCDWFFAQERIQRSADFMGFSRLETNFNYEQNALIAYEHGIVQPRDVSCSHSDCRIISTQHMQVIGTGDYLWMCTGYCEWALRRLLHFESVTGRQAHVVLVFDMADVHALDWTNPTSPWARLLLCRAELFENTYPDLMGAIYVLHASAAVRAAIHMARLFLSAHHLALLRLLADTEAELPGHLGGAQYIPRAYGGTLTCTPSPANLHADPNTCMTRAVPLTPAHHLTAGHRWRTHGVTYDPVVHTATRHRIGAGGTLCVHHAIAADKSPVTLFYQLSTTSIVDVGVRVWHRETPAAGGKTPAVKDRVDPLADNVLPLWPLVAHPLADEDAVAVLPQPGDNTVTIDMRNRSRFFALHVDLVSFVVPMV